MFPSIPPSPGSMAASQPLPPLPDLNNKPGGKSAAPDDPFQATMNKIKPVNDAVNDIHTAIAKLARTGIIPIGGVLDQLSALASSLVPMAAQSMIVPGGQGALPPPSGAPPDLGAGGPPPGAPSPGPAPTPGGPGV